MTTENPYRDRLSVETPESVAFAYDLAGIASRAAALFIDTVLVSVLLLAELLAVTLIYSVFGDALPDSAFIWVYAGVLIVAFITAWAYFVLLEVLRNGRTVGKRALGIRVVRDDGGRVGVMDSIIRNVVRLVDMLPGYYGVGLVAVLFSAQNKRLGDMAAGTVVVRDTGELTLSEAGLASNAREALARQFFARRASLSPEARYQVAVEVLRAWGEESGSWDEPTVAGRIADLAGLRSEVDASTGTL
jgi:uncharacterized RDD family membrane protein YckC